MAIYKNTAGQALVVYAYDGTTVAGTDPSKTGDAANITARISKDGGASAATNDVNPTELDSTNHKGIYLFNLTQSETNADVIVVSPGSSTSNILLDPVVVYTVDPLTASEVNAEVLDVLATDNFSELTSVPAANAPLSDKINFMFMLSRNKIVEDSASETQTLYADDGTTPIAVATVEDAGTTTTRGEMTDAP